MGPRKTSTFQRVRLLALQKTPIDFRGNHHHYGRFAPLRSGRGSTLGASEADSALSKFASTCCCIFLPHLEFGQTHAQPPMGIKLLQERSLRAGVLLSQEQTPGARCACHPPAAAQPAKAEASRGTQKKGGKPSNTPK